MTGVPAIPLGEELPPPLRLAIAYASREARLPWTALLVLDRRLARAALGASEPLLGQLRLAWWRERFLQPATAWPEGEPLLAALRGFDSERAALAGLVDGWERLCGGEPGPADLAALADARAGCVAALARLLGQAALADRVTVMARRWSQADLATRLDLAEPGGDHHEASPLRSPLPRPLRPLSVLLELAAQDGQPRGPLRFLRIVRLGMLGR